MPYWDRKEKLKHEVTVAGTKRDGHQFIGGYAGGGYGACILKGAGGGPWAPALWHEWGHGALMNGVVLGGGEAQADAHQCLADPSMLKGNHHVKTPWRNPFNGTNEYGYTMFYNIMGDDPNWGYAWFTCLPYGVKESSVFQALARCGQQRGLFEDGIRGLGDMVGEYGARLATFDCELEDLFRRAYFAPTRSWLETVDRDKRVYRIPWEESPEPYGVNIVRLVADESVREFTVDFTGLHDPDFFSDWRACIVAVGADGIRRYSPMWNKGPMTMKCRPDDTAYWLTVTATPTALYTGRLMRDVYSGRHAYRYPWSVQLTGVRPGAPSTVRDRIGEMPPGKPHANGGGFVADSAKVAATAYVGPDAMVLGGAQVSDHAVVEDYAVVTDRAVVSDHARVGGRAVIRGSVKLDGHARAWTSVDRPEDASPHPKRLGEEKPHKFGLWANYAMDRAENTLLEDYYRFTHGADRRYGRRLGPNLDGYLYGRPEFVVDGDHRGFRFNGKTQYAELCPRVADLGAMTVEVNVKLEKQGVQTIFDFGSSATDFLWLRIEQGGQPAFAAIMRGKAIVAMSGTEPVSVGKWTSLRVEIDGSRMTLWMQGEKVAEKSSTFRPWDVFRGGKPKRNFLAASRRGDLHFKGIIDRVVVYHTVHDNYNKLPPPTQDAPRRPTAEVIERIEKRYGNVEELNRKISAKAQELLKPYSEYQKEQEARIKELESRDPALAAAREKLQAVEENVRKRKQETNQQFDELSETIRARAEIDRLRRQSGEIRSQVAKLENERLAGDAELKTMQTQRREAEQSFRTLERSVRETFENREDVAKRRKEIAELRKHSDESKRKQAGELDRTVNESWTAFRNQNAEYAKLEGQVRNLAEKIRKREYTLRDEVRQAQSKLVDRQRELDRTAGEKNRALHGKREKYLVERTGQLDREVAAATAEVAKANEKALASYMPEKLWTRGFAYQAYRGYYNTNYARYLNDHAKALLGGAEMRENIGSLRQLEKAVSSDDDWSTTIDWDWRMRQEVDGSIKDLPLQRKWIERARGPVVTEKPVGVNSER